MKISDIINEAKGTTLGEVPEHQKPIMRQTINFRDLGGFDRTHHLYRIMLACAMSDGKNAADLLELDPLTWHSKYNTAHPYTKEESNMIQGALKTIGAESNHAVSDSTSVELPEVNKLSPVTGFKGYKRR